MTSAKPNVLFMVPARSGSVGMPRKNVRKLGSHPLIAHALLAIRQYGGIESCYVITDGDEIADIARQYGANVLIEETTTGKATLDDVANKMLQMIPSNTFGDDTIFLTVQPTCPFVTPKVIQDAVDAFDRGAGCVVTCTDDRHLSWNIGPKGNPVPAYSERVNRQMLPPHYRESGAVIGARIGDIKKHKTRIVAPINLIEITKKESLDIDTYEDFLLAEHLYNRKRILIRADGGYKIGMGHIYRALAIAYELVGHEIAIVTKAQNQESFVADFLEKYPFRVIKIDNENDFFEQLSAFKPAITIVDILDTREDFIKRIKDYQTKVICFEDLGGGAAHADLVVNELYFNSNVQTAKQLSGVHHAILAPAFEAETSREIIESEVKRVLVVFGGTDPSGLTAKALQALSDIGYKGQVDVVCGPGHNAPLPSLTALNLTGTLHQNVRHMPGLMKLADLALSSAGRTVTELMSLGIPTLVMCQNEKELTHTHANSAHGVLNLGLGPLVDKGTLQNHLQFVIESHKYRVHMNSLARAALKGRSNRECLKLFGSMIGEDL